MLNFEASIRKRRERRRFLEKEEKEEHSQARCKRFFEVVSPSILLLFVNIVIKN
jgi:hypothetical protein